LENGDFWVVEGAFCWRSKQDNSNSKTDSKTDHKPSKGPTKHATSYSNNSNSHGQGGISPGSQTKTDRKSTKSTKSTHAERAGNGSGFSFGQTGADFWKLGKFKQES
jgi:hypothetical protein